MTDGGRAKIDGARNTCSNIWNVFWPTPISSSKTTYPTLG
jgi:hypothetical protein